MRRRREQSGIALITVLCLILSASALVTALVTVSQTSTLNLRSYNEFMRSGYLAEGALARIGYLITADRHAYSDRSLGDTDYESYDGERFLADGTERELDYYGTKIRYRITDANSGWNLADNAHVQVLDQIQQALVLDSDFDSEAASDLSDRISDYVDTDDNLTGGGMESGDYQALNLAPLPRNNNLQFREELLYIPGFRELFPPDSDGRLTAIKLLPPDELTTLDGNPTMFTATKLQLKVLAGLDDDTADEVLAALRNYRREGTLLEDQLDALLLSTLERSFAWAESDVYTVNILRAGPEGRPAARLVATFGVIPDSGPANGVLNFLEYFRF